MSTVAAGVAATSTTSRVLGFVPSKHGWHFANQFVNHPIGGTGIETFGLCGGMARTARDYWNAGLPIPAHTRADFGGLAVPAEGGRLRAYIYARQMHSFFDYGFTRWVIAPGVKKETVHEWTVQNEFPKIKAAVDAGLLTIVGLWSVSGGPATGHQVLCYGYETSPQVRLFVYDNNFPDREMFLTVPSPEAGVEERDVAAPGSVVARWRGFFHYSNETSDSKPESFVPPYRDLEVSQGIALNPDGDNVGVGAPMTASFTVRNVGEYSSRFEHLEVDVERREQTSGVLGGLLGGRFVPIADELAGSLAGVTILHPGESRSLTRTSSAFGSEPGTHRITVGYRSQLGHDLRLPPAGGAQNPKLVVLRERTTVVADTSVSVAEAVGVVDTGVDLEPGMDYQLDASGEMWAGVLFTLENGPAGWNNVTTNPKFPLHSGPAAHPYALIGRFGNDPYFYVGDGLSRRRYTGTTTKRLFLAINDDRPDNGTGAFLCRIQTWR